MMRYGEDKNIKLIFTSVDAAGEGVGLGSPVLHVSVVGLAVGDGVLAGHITGNSFDLAP